MRWLDVCHCILGWILFAAMCGIPTAQQWRWDWQLQAASWSQTECVVLPPAVLQSLAQVLVTLGEFKHTHTHKLTACQVQSWSTRRRCGMWKGSSTCTLSLVLQRGTPRNPPPTHTHTAQSMPIVPLFFVTSKFQEDKVWLAHCRSEQKCKSNWRQRKIDFPDFEWHLIHSHILPKAMTDIHHKGKLKVALHQFSLCV